ncbi:hypothetical protein yc1106_01935 [Curvularia clavata]|uniref:Heterokaryon incompatibility domain-containing protein n=1 Tax=Curvularia clavata TaxID=95742 RepID=A0A9Q9DQT1_CURCL|nr:hypothetical protein yc1106_01935 [Curvularia clavata]
MVDSALYQPLNTIREEFRLLRIQPSDDFHSIITCQLFTASLIDKPSYNALSYEWGNPNVTKSVIVNSTELQVTSNLEAALRRIRTTHSEVILWVDGLCINQRDVAEKNIQVAMMGRLYSNTTLTYAWLGEDDGGSATRTFQFLRSFLGDFGKFVEDVDYFAIRTSENVRENKRYRGEDRVLEDIRSGKLTMNEFNLNDFHEVCRRGYWWRTWVQQELILSPKVLLLSGSASIPLNLVIAFAMLNFTIKALASEWTESFHNMSDMLRIRWIPQVVRLITTDFENLVSLVSRLQFCRVTDPRDKIYGVLGIYRGTVSITVDYDKLVALVFADLVRNLAAESGKLYLRQFPRNTVDPHVPDLPSWTPNFFRDNVDSASKTGDRTGVHESRGWSARIHPTSCPSLLRTSGCTVDTVQSVFRFSPENEASDVLCNFIGSYVTMPHPTGATFLQVLCCNMFKHPTVDILRRRFSLHMSRAFLHWILKCGMERGAFNQRFDNFIHEHNLVDIFKSVPEDISTSLQFAKFTGAIDHLVEPYKSARDHSHFLRMTPQQRMASFWGSQTYPNSFLADIDWRIPSKATDLESIRIHIGKWTRKKAIIITEQGYTGFASYDTLVGDQISIIAGCPWPAIIRPSGKHHEIVGGSFIYGMMDGELFKDGRLTDDRQQIFEFI